MATTRLLIAAAALSASLPAFAQDAEAPAAAPASEGNQTCIYTMTETRTNPRKPNVYEGELNCGAEPTPLQAVAIAQVNNLTIEGAGVTGAVAALEFMQTLGYEVEGQSFRESYTGRQVFAVWTLVRTEEAAPPPPPAPEPVVEELPEATDMPEGEEADEAL